MLIRSATAVALAAASLTSASAVNAQLLAHKDLSLATALAIMNEEADALCGAWNARDPQRSHERGGTAPTPVVMGGQRLPIRLPRVHAGDEDGDRAGDIAGMGVDDLVRLALGDARSSR